VILNGGTSKGAEDYNAPLLAESGQLICRGVLAAPGHPICIALVDNKPVINLPGPMHAAWFGMDWCVRAVVSHALGIPVAVRPRVRAVLSEDIDGPRKLPDGFEFFYRVAVKRTTAGYEAWPIPLGRVEGKRTQGFHSGQCIIRSPQVGIKGSEIEVELLYGQEFI
jgi:molybdopterin molybdotransferase/putative molybdopterin biosynthesis protein